MAQMTMYGAINNSPKTGVSANMTAADTIIPVGDINALPEPPNLATLGEDENAEVISYSGKNGNALTGVVRGIKGTTASPWPEGTPIYRAYTAYDHDTFKANIEDLEVRKVATVNGKLPDETGNVEVASGGGDIVNGALTVWQRYNAADSSTYTNPSAKYVADRFRASGTGTIRPNPREFGADITGSITVQYWMEPADFALLPDPVEVYYSVDGQMEKISTAKGAVPTDSGKNACVFQRTVTNATLDWISLYPKRPVRPYSEELVLCQRYTVIYPAKNGNIVMFTGNPLGDTTKFRFVAQLPAVMRTKPTASGKYLSAAAMMNPAEISHSLNSVSVTADAGSSLMIDAVTDSLTEKTLYALRIVNGGYILFDAEIY